MQRFSLGIVGDGIAFLQRQQTPDFAYVYAS